MNDEELRVFPASSPPEVERYLEVRLTKGRLLPLAYFQEKKPYLPLAGIGVAVPLIKGEGFERVLQASTQLGVGKLAIFQGERSVRSFKRNLELKVSKVVLKESIAARRWYLPVIGFFPSLGSLLSAVGEVDVIVLDKSGIPLWKFDGDLGALKRGLVVFGPEGGFSPQEKAILSRRGSLYISLGL